MRHCFSHTDLGQQNAVFHKFVIQIAIIQYSGRSRHAWALAKPLKKFPKSPIQSGISLNLRTGPAGHATLFNQ